MTPAQLERRLREIEAEVAKLAPPCPAPEWLSWTTNEELDWLEKMFRDLDASGVSEPTQADQLRA